MEFKFDHLIKIKNDIKKVLHKSENYTLEDLEVYMKYKYNAVKVELKDINLIMKKGYKLYHKNCNTPLAISEEMILDKDYYATYIIYTNLDDVPSKKDSVYLHTGYIIGSKNKYNPDCFQIFNGTRDITDSLEILCNYTFDQIKRRYI